MTIKFRQFQKNHSCLTSCLTTSGAAIDDLIVAFLPTPYTGKITKRQRPTLNRIFFADSKSELEAFLHPSPKEG